MKHVTGIGGIFFKSENPETLYQWYEKHLGIARAADGSGVIFKWGNNENAEPEGMTVWSIFPRDTQYFGPNAPPFMINYRVHDLDGLLQALREEGVQIDPRQEDYEYGRFAWITDPEGNRVELWEPPKTQLWARTRTTTNHVGTGALGCPVEQSSTRFWSQLK